ncbi:YsnF/AvaK domain-containing protein [Arthrobacter sp. UYEF36]|uniref:YsnF/AvaK domain-containing protein n=1 Tax=Arthrobacter sp. UYEF36 TaxID=1756366 RepID=UPI0033990326
MLAKEHIDDLLQRNGNVLTNDRDKIGSIGQIYADDDNGQPTWVTAKTGLFGTSESFVPLEGARVEGGDLLVPYTKDQIKDAPRVDTDGHLDPAEEDRLYAHYGLSGGGRTYTDATAGRDADHREKDYADTDRGTVGRDTSGPTTDDAMTRSEERLNVGTEQEATGRVRLRKYVTTENVTQTVPVQREEVRIEREPITDANRGAAMSGAGISEEEHEVVLHEERPVVEKETVPVERVRLEKETVTDEVTVDEEVRKERIETDGDDNTRR